MGAAFLKNTYRNSERKSRFLRLTPDKVLILLPFDCSMKPSTYTRCVSGAVVGGKTGKTSVLPGFSKEERGGGGGGAPDCYGGLT